MIARSTARRRGLTLLEVVVAMAIFLMSLLAIGELISMGTERAMAVRLQSRTSLRCQAKLAEIMIGSQSAMDSADYSDFTEDGDLDADLQWKMRMSAPDVNAANLNMVTVWVRGKLPSGKFVESKLSQLMLDPNVRGSTMDPPIVPKVGTAPL